MMITILLYIIIFIYCLAIIALIYGFTKVNSFEYLGLKPKTKFSIVVPFRNEAENLPKLLDSFSKLNYPMDFFEVILVDDFSLNESQTQASLHFDDLIKDFDVHYQEIKSDNFEGIFTLVYAFEK